LCEEWVASLGWRNVPSYVATVAEFENNFGEILKENHFLTTDKDNLTKAIKIYNQAAENFKKVDLPSRVAETYWKIAGNLDALYKYSEAAENFEKAVKENKDDLAAVIVEPVIGNIGLVLPKTGFLETLRDLTEDYGIVLIFDEVITGFRLALGGAQEYYGVTPDMTTLGKVLGGGFPVAAFVGKEEIMKMVAPVGKVYQAGTYSGNPVSVAAGLATLKTLRESGTGFYAKMESNCREIVTPLKKTIHEYNLKVQVNHIASVFQLFFTETPVYDYATVKTSDTNKFIEYHSKLLEKGVFIPPSQFETCFLSSEHSQQDIKHTVTAVTALLGLQETLQSSSLSASS